MSSDFKVGDVVQLKSGIGPYMTVDCLGSERIDCVWFDGSYALHSGCFAIDALKKVEPNGHDDPKKHASPSFGPIS